MGRSDGRSRDLTLQSFAFRWVNNILGRILSRVLDYRRLFEHLTSKATLNQSNCNDINSVKNPPMIHSFAYIRWLVQGSVEACRWRISRWNLSWEGVACKHSSLIQSRWIINFWGISPWPSSLARFGDPVFTTLGCRHEISKWIPKMAVGSCHDLRLMECLKQCRQVPPGGLGVTFKTLEYL